MINGDFHMHTSFSTDSEASARAMIDGAIKKGLKVICVTDHWDEDFPEKYAPPGRKISVLIYRNIFNSFRP